MKLSGKSIQNSIDDSRYSYAVKQVQEQQWEEYERVHDGSGRSEEMPSDLDRRHRAELAILQADRDELSVMEWIKAYGEPERERRVADQRVEVAGKAVISREDQKHDVNAVRTQEAVLSLMREVLEARGAGREFIAATLAEVGLRMRGADLRKDLDAEVSLKATSDDEKLGRSLGTALGVKVHQDSEYGSVLEADAKRFPSATIAGPSEASVYEQLGRIARTIGNDKDHWMRSYLKSDVVQAIESGLKAEKHERVEKATLVQGRVGRELER